MMAMRKHSRGEESLEEGREENRIVDLGVYRRRLEEMDERWERDAERENPEALVRSGRVVDLEGRSPEPGEEKGTFLGDLMEWSRWFLDVLASVCVALMTLAFALYVLAF